MAAPRAGLRTGRDGAVIVAGRGAIVDRGCADAEVEVLRPENRGAGLLVRDVRGEPAHALRAEVVPAGQQARGSGIDEQRLVEVEWCRGLVHLGRRARGDAGEERGRPDCGQPCPAGARHVPDDQVGALHREVPAVGPEGRGLETIWCGRQADVAGGRVPRGGEHVLGDTVPRGPGLGQESQRNVVLAAADRCHACSVRRAAVALHATGGPCFSPGLDAVRGEVPGRFPG